MTPAAVEKLAKRLWRAWWGNGTPINAFGRIASAEDWRNAARYVLKHYEPKPRRRGALT